MPHCNSFAQQGKKRYFSTAAECDFSKLSNKICTIDVKIHIFASSIKRIKRIKRTKRTKKNENQQIRQATKPIDNNGGNMYALT